MDDAAKDAIRRRGFFAAEAKGQSGAPFGYRWCPECRGRGDVCVDHADGDLRWASFETCATCRGDRIVALDGAPAA